MCSRFMLLSVMEQHKHSPLTAIGTAIYSTRLTRATDCRGTLQGIPLNGALRRLCTVHLASAAISITSNELAYPRRTSADGMRDGHGWVYVDTRNDWSGTGSPGFGWGRHIAHDWF